jgi:hypothetical protein
MLISMAGKQSINNVVSGKNLLSALYRISRLHARNLGSILKRGYRSSALFDATIRSTICSICFGHYCFLKKLKVGFISGSDIEALKKLSEA